MTRFFSENVSLAGFARRAVLIMLALGMGLAGAVFGDQPPVAAPGEVVDWSHSAYQGDRPLQLRLPENFDAERSWPLILWFHGTNGRPTTHLPNLGTQGKGFVIVGMNYVQRGQFQYSPDAFAAEVRAYHQVIADLQASGRIRIDPRRIYVGGFSKGGWLSALFLEKDPRVVGAMVMGGGVFDRPDAATEKFATRKRVYVGIGGLDLNLAVSRKAERFLADLGAEVCLDVWPGVGHDYPRGENDLYALQQWLRVEAAMVPGVAKGEDLIPQELRDEAIEWLGDKVRELRDGSDDNVVARWLALEDLATKPFSQLIDQSARTQAQELMAELRADPKVVEESSVRDRYLEIQRTEYVDLTVERLARCSADYKTLWQKHPQTKFGELARQSFERTQQLLRTAELPSR